MVFPLVYFFRDYYLYIKPIMRIVHLDREPAIHGALKLGVTAEDRTWTQFELG